MKLPIGRPLLAAATFTLSASPALAQQGPPELFQLKPAGVYESGIFDESAAEIVAYDPETFRMFITNANDNTVDVVSIRKVRRPELEFKIDVSDCGASPNSVDVRNGIVAIAIEADPNTDPGSVGFYDTDGEFIKCVEVGALPDMLTFTPDGDKVIVANEGQPEEADDPMIDPPGSVSVIDVAGGTIADTSTTIEFTDFDGQEAMLRNRGVRIFEGIRTGDGSVGVLPTSQDVEPEYVAVSPDGTTAFVTLQEANAFAVIDLETNTLADILPAGVKDHSTGLPRARVVEWTVRPDLGTTPAGQTILLGGLSGLWVEGVDGAGRIHFATVPDRGPNGAPTDVDGDGDNERPFALPDYQARVVRGILDPVAGTVFTTEQIPLFRSDGTTPITGLPNIPDVDEEPVDLNGDPLPYDAFGADLEGIIVADDGSFWMVDEYRPSIYHFDESGVLIDRYVPEGTAALAGEAVGTFGSETLPAEYSNRRANRGFEAMALDPDAGILYAFIQTPLSNPDRAAGDASFVIRMLGIDPATGEPQVEYAYLLEKPAFRDGNVDKIGDAVYVGDGRFLIIERDSSVETYAKKLVFELDVKYATDVLGADFGGETLEQQTPDALAEAGIVSPFKRKVANLPSIGYLAGDKPEGLSILPDGRLLVLNDNDFGLADEELPSPPDGSVPLNPDPVPVAFGIVNFLQPNGIDASDRDDAINIANWPVLGMLHPDAIASFKVEGETYYITANEGDARDDFGRESPERIADLTLDADEFPDAVALQADEALGRLDATDVDGDLDGDGEFERLFVYGGRSFSIWDRFGNLVYDSGDLLEYLTGLFLPEDFNSTNDENGSFDSRSDAKGPEPEAVTTGFLNGNVYGFIGLERVGGIVVVNLNDPSNPSFVQYINLRDFSVPLNPDDLGPPDAETLSEIGDLGPEGLRFIKRKDSPNGQPLLLVSNEVSGTTRIFRIVPPGVGKSTGWKDD